MSNLPVPEHSAADELRDIAQVVHERQILRRYFDENPYIALGAAAGLGYIVGGGALSPFTRRLIRIGMKAMLIPVAAAQLKNLTGDTLQEDS